MFIKDEYVGAHTKIHLAVDPNLKRVTRKYFEYCEKETLLKQTSDDVFIRKASNL